MEEDKRADRPNESNETLNCGGSTEVFLNSPPPYDKQYYAPQWVKDEIKSGHLKIRIRFSDTDENKPLWVLDYVIVSPESEEGIYKFDTKEFGMLRFLLVPSESARKCIVCPGDLLVRHPDGTLEKRKQSESDAYRIPVLGCLYIDCSLEQFVTLKNAANDLRDAFHDCQKEQTWTMSFEWGEQ